MNPSHQWGALPWLVLLLVGYPILVPLGHALRWLGLLR